MSSFDEEKEVTQMQNIVTEKVDNIDNNAKGKKHSTLIYCLIFIALIISIISFYYAYSFNTNLTNLKYENENLRNSLNEIENENQIIIADNENLWNEFMILNLSYCISDGGVVTDKIYINKSIIRYSDNSILGFIDIDPQPSYLSYFVGQGKINLSDREIRSMLDELIKSLNDYVQMTPISDKFDLNNCTLYLTHNNFDIASYINGTLKLSGE